MTTTAASNDDDTISRYRDFVLEDERTQSISISVTTDVTMPKILCRYSLDVLEYHGLARGIIDVFLKRTKKGACRCRYDDTNEQYGCSRQREIGVDKQVSAMTLKEYLERDVYADTIDYTSKSRRTLQLLYNFFCMLKARAQRVSLLTAIVTSKGYSLRAWSYWIETNYIAPTWMRLDTRCGLTIEDRNWILTRHPVTLDQRYSLMELDELGDLLFRYVSRCKCIDSSTMEYIHLLLVIRGHASLFDRSYVRVRQRYTTTTTNDEDTIARVIVSS